MCIRDRHILFPFCLARQRSHSGHGRIPIKIERSFHYHKQISPFQSSENTGDVSRNVPFLFGLVYICNFYQYRRFLHSAETGVDGCSEHLHRRVQTHISIYQGRNVFSQFPDIMGQYLVIFIICSIAMPFSLSASNISVSPG